MGLDEFKTGDSSDNESDGNVDTEQEQPEPKTYGEIGGSHEVNVNSSDADEAILGIAPQKWVSMTEKERILAVRQLKFADFRPSVQLDDRWEYRDATEIECVCNNKMTFSKSVQCGNCGRTYKEVGRTVTKIKDPEDDLIHNDAQTE